MAEIDEFWKEVEKLLNPLVEKKLTYRLYHDDNGNLLFYSMDNLPGNYIEIDKDTFALACSKVKVKDGKLVKLHANQSYKLHPSSDGVSTHTLDITIVVAQEPSVKWNLKYYE
jgi:hypothetical protein